MLLVRPGGASFGDFAYEVDPSTLYPLRHKLNRPRRYGDYPQPDLAANHRAVGALSRVGSRVRNRSGGHYYGAAVVGTNLPRKGRRCPR